MRHRSRTVSVLWLVAAACLLALPSFGQQEPWAPQPPPIPKRGWGPEQATGQPDTMEAADRPTAWAPREPNGGPEWLRVEFDKEVSIAEVRIRDTCGPGAITRVAAIPKEGEELTLWEGREPEHDVPGNFEAFADKAKDVVAKCVKVYLDTRLVPGWNEIDAVELVGKDGTRQWASKATASSTFGERHAVAVVGPFPQAFGAADAFNELPEAPVKVRLEGNETLEGIFLRSRGEFIAIRQPAAGRTLLINTRRIVYVELADRPPRAAP